MEHAALKLKQHLMSLIFAFLAALCLSLPVSAADQDIVLLFTNDVHCGIEDNIGYAKLAGYRTQVRERTPYVLMLDAGDAIQGGATGTLTDGDAVINIMNELRYDFAIPGNHEFDYGMEKFFALSKKLSCGYTACNFMNLETGTPIFPGFKLFTLGGTKIGLVGVDTPESIIQSTPIYFQDSAGNYRYGFCEDHTGKKLYDIVQQNVNRARALGAEKVILVGHLGQDGTTGKWRSDELIRHTKGIDALIDGHSHEVYLQTVEDQEGKPVPIAQTGTKLKNIGEITISPEGKLSVRLLSAEDLAGVEPDAHIQEYIHLVTGALEQQLQQSLGVSRVPLTIYDPKTGKRLVRSRETNLGDFCADAFREVLDADIALVNAGGIRADLEPGEISLNDILNLYPFNNMVCVVAVKGQVILDALEMGAKNYPQEGGGFMQVSGLTYKINAAIPSSILTNEREQFVGVGGARRVHDVMVGNAPLDPEKTYTVGGINYLLREYGDGMTMFQDAVIVRDNIMPDSEVIADYIEQQLGGVIGEQYAAPQGRIVFD